MQIYNFIFNSYTKLSIILEIKITKRKTGYNIRYMQFCRRRNTKLHIATSLCEMAKQLSVEKSIFRFELITF